MEYLETTVVPLTQLQRFPGNSRKHAQDWLRDSAALGQYKSLLVRRLEDGQLVIVAGNGTADALEAVGAKEARVEVWNYTDHEARSVNIRDNRLFDLAGDDDDALTALLRLQDGDFEALGYNTAEIAKLLGEEIMPEPGDAPVDADEGKRWGIIVECGTEDEQVRLLEELGGQGLNVRALLA